MPIRFQVDGDFYDHPKTLDASDAAVALWTRAGSYSTAKLLDGFVPEGALARLSKQPDDAAAELVRRGLWRRVRGGFQFHQWEHRNLTRARVEADRDYERDKKRRQRGEAAREAKPQVEAPTVPKGQTGDGRGTPPGVPAVSVSMSESMSVSVSGQPLDPVPDPPDPSPQEPPPRCPKHLDDDDPPPCHACGDARRTLDTWRADQAAAQLRAAALARQRDAHDRAEANRLAIAACRLCDDRGYAGPLPCPHDPATTDRTRRGAAAADEPR
jgi:hypothetical protein